MERENQRIALTKRLLKEALLQLLKEKELDKISVTELCKTAEINRATFYRHYTIPRDVLIEIQSDMIQQLKREIPLPQSLEDLKPAVYTLCTFMDHHAELIQLIIRCNTDADFIHLVDDLFMELWKELHLKNYLKKLNEEDLRLLTVYTAGGSYFILRSWMMGSIQKSAQEMADYVFELLNKTEFLTYGTLLGIPRK